MFTFAFKSSSYIIWSWRLSDLVITDTVSRNIPPAQWRREGVCRPGHTSVLPTPQWDEFCNHGIFRISDMAVWTNPWGSLLFPFLSFPPLPSPLSISLSHWITLNRPRSRSQNYSAIGSPSGVWGEAQPKLNLVHFNRHLVTTNLKIFLKIKWQDFMQNFRIYAKFGNTWIVQNIELRLSVKQ